MRGTAAPSSRDASGSAACASDAGESASAAVTSPSLPRFTLRVGSSLTDFAEAAATVDRAQVKVFELTAGIVLAEVIDDFDHPYPEDGEPYRSATIAESVARAVRTVSSPANVPSPAGVPSPASESDDDETSAASSTALILVERTPTDLAPYNWAFDRSVRHLNQIHWNRLRAADDATPRIDVDALPQFPGFSLDTNFSLWVHDNLRSEHVAATSTILGTTTARSLRHFTQAMTLVHGLPRFFARAQAGHFTLAHLTVAADLCQTVAFRHLPELDRHLATRRSDVTSDTLRASLRKLITVLQPPKERTAAASQHRRVDVETFSDGRARLSVTASAIDIHACYARVQAMARAIHAGQSDAFGLAPGVEIIDERGISALMCDIMLRPQPKLSIRVREINPVTGIEEQREAPLLDDNGNLRFHADENTISGLTDLLDASDVESPAAAAARDHCNFPTDPAISVGTDFRQHPRGASFFRGGQPQPLVVEYTVVASMPTGPEWTRSQAGLVITLPMLGLTGDSDLPGILPDGSPIPVEMARRIAADSPTLTRVLTDPATGTPIDAQAVTYAIPKAVRKTLISQWEVCTVPGCRRSAEKSEIDHVEPFFHPDPLKGGLTRFGNLHPLCRKDHALKTARWYSVRMEDTGTATSAVEYEFPHGLMTTVSPPDQPINVAHALELCRLLDMKPCRWQGTLHDVPPESSVVEVRPTDARVGEHEAELRRAAEAAAREQALKDAIERSNAERRRRRLEQLLDWEHATFPDCLPPGSNPLTTKALPPGRRRGYSSPRISIWSPVECEQGFSHPPSRRIDWDHDPLDDPPPF